ncbi:VOC family protein [Agrobacterium tumefaciens]|nr:VOC family protein [Agrobacterium tumefaciens]NTE23062.1 VOC family protein [Agrobacterium tumefaciens]
MKTTFNLDTIIFYVQNVEKLTAFYATIFGFEVVEKFEPTWALLSAGACKIGLHQIGEGYLDKSKGAFKVESNAKIVFEIDQDIHALKTYLVDQGVEMREVKTFEAYDYWLCDGVDPEGNVFQLKQQK